MVADLEAVALGLSSLAERLQLPADEVARGVVRLANNNMVNALKLVSLSRGHDPRELTLEQPFVLTARTRGLSDIAVRFKHALRHAVLPGISLSGWAIGALISGAVVIEVIFSRKGLGRQKAAGCLRSAY